MFEEGDDGGKRGTDFAGEGEACTVLMCEMRSFGGRGRNVRGPGGGDEERGKGSYRRWRR